MDFNESITGSLRKGSRASQIIDLVLVCLEEKSAAILESGNMDETNSDDQLLEKVSYARQ